MKDFNNIVIEKNGKTAILRINREAKLNALNKETLSEISTALSTLQEDQSVRGLIVTGAGEKAFVAGADIQEFQDFNGQQASDLAAEGQSEVMNKLENFPKPVIAAINGFALGGGLELALACHFRLASDNAKLGLPETSLGLIPGYGGTQRLTQLVGKGKALEMIMTADMIIAAEAHRWGLVNYVVPPDELIDKCVALLEKIYTRSGNAVANAIKAVNIGILDSEKGYQAEIELFGASFESEESKEGISAFIEKRKPNF